MGKLIDLSNLKFGKLSVIKRNGVATNGDVLWLCKCECGNDKIVKGSLLRMNKTTSCGCNNKIKNISHNLSKTRLYRIYYHMKDRCYKENYKDYKDYGERGIKVCDEWKNDFMNFYNWAINNGYNDTLTIDRINVNGNYEPSNCRWVNQKTQQNNRRNNHLITYNGETLTMKQWAEKLNINYGTLSSRLNYKKMSIEKALTMNKNERRKVCL